MLKNINIESDVMSPAQWKWIFNPVICDAGVNECFDRYGVMVSLTPGDTLISALIGQIIHPWSLIGQQCPSVPPSGDNDSIAARLLQGQECK